MTGREKRVMARKRGMDIVETSYAMSGDSRAQMYEEQDGEIRLFFERKI